MPQEISSVPEQWQLTLDVIKSKAQSLVVENNGLQAAYQKSSEEVQKLRQSIADTQNKNEEMDHLLKERHGRTDQDLRIEELTSIVKTKRANARDLDEQVARLTQKKADLDQKIQQMKYTVSDIELHQQAQKQQPKPVETPAPTTGDDQINQWRKQLEDQSKQEVILENELSDLKTGNKTQDLNADDIERQNRLLEARLDILRLQKMRHISRSPVPPPSEPKARRYNQLKQRKDELLFKINAYAMRLDKLRESSLMALSWSVKKKQMVHELVAKDAHNNQMRQQIKDLHEDIDLLREQVGKLERRVDFAQGVSR